MKMAHLETPRVLLGIAMLVGHVMGCQRTTERELRDTEGRRFLQRCKGESDCLVEQQAGPRADAPKTNITILSTGKLVGACSVASGRQPDSASDCRALVCSDDSACPSVHGLPHGTCVRGFCIEPAAEATTEDDAVMLCLAGTGLGRTSPAQVQRYSLAVNCGSPCVVPSPCARID
ncbi:hypothetical protein ACFL5O_09510 [Myxococcota bacterium]